ncbi:hypothetical protein PPL_10498 [Heterostelium album PN500]|uniref:Integrase zinc-binding domain-containing protein n=1 Tax=Heterostelium pallidum (strain ATCC 26659 / Pp 5 / PN500) TaxID=670386 RepID=D3BR93_HETP5|nr:hypothetical protein PPL_10498 [Heterostelium album PN500]EFA75925.1 hypothetical protein PPL_10498 [Heterostelium album PN500]|eukprot:XP_020428059.1 hypothetical protein PPL_10498 [Heterostelium album PN500]
MEVCALEEQKLNEYGLTLDIIKTEQGKDDFCIKIRKALDGTELKAPVDLPFYSLEDDVLYFNYDHSKVNPFSSRVLTSRIWVPLSLRNKVMSYYHDDLLTGGHLGFIKTLEKIKCKFYWLTIIPDLKSFISSCMTCALITSK